MSIITVGNGCFICLHFGLGISPLIQFDYTSYYSAVQTACVHKGRSMQSEESPAYPATAGLPGRSVFPEPWLGSTELASRVAATAALLSAGIGGDSNKPQSVPECEQSHKETSQQRSVIR